MAITADATADRDHDQEATAARLLAETTLNLSQAAKTFPPGRDGRPLSPATLTRWILHGTDGVRLEAVRIGGYWLTSKEALARFAATLTQAHRERANRPATQEVKRGRGRPSNASRAEKAEALADAEGL